MYGRTTIRASYDVSLLKMPDSDHSPDAEGSPGLFLSERHSWLPTNFAVSTDGSSTKALAYINNLCPYLNAGMYPVIEQIVARFVPLWERVLGETQVGERYQLPQRQASDVEYDWAMKAKDCARREETDERESREDEGSDDADDSEEGSEEEEESMSEWLAHTNHDFVMPAITSPFVPYKVPEQISLKGRNIQVIVKLANIHLVRIIQIHAPRCTDCAL